MTVTYQIKTLNRKIMQNEAQHDLDRKAAKISALSSNNLDKYEYLTGEDLGLKPSKIEQAKFEYSPLGKIFNNGLHKNYQKGLFKRLKNIENGQKNFTRCNDNESIYYTPKSQLDSEHDKDEDKKNNNNNYNIDTKPQHVSDYLKSLSQEAEDLMNEIKDAGKDINIKSLLFIGSNQKKFNFNIFRMTLNFLSDISNGKISLKNA